MKKADLGLNLTTKRTRKREFLAEMEGVRWNIAMRQGRRKLLDKSKLVDDLTDQLERTKASTRAKVEQRWSR